MALEIARLQQLLQQGVVPGVPTEEATEFARRLDGVGAEGIRDVFGQFPVSTQLAVANYLEGLDPSSTATALDRSRVSLEDIWNPQSFEDRRSLAERSREVPKVAAQLHGMGEAEIKLESLLGLGMEPSIVAGLADALRRVNNGEQLTNAAGVPINAEDIMSLIEQLLGSQKRQNARPVGGSFGPGANTARRSGTRLPKNVEKVDLSHLGKTSEKGKNLLRAIAGQESGGNPTVINRDAARADKYGIGAIGRYQMLGSNVAAWSKEAADAGVIPKEVAAQLAADPRAITKMPEVQDAVAAFKMEQYYERAPRNLSDDDKVRWVAAAWYSGDGKNMNSSKPQGGYPSIRQYTMDVLDRYRQIA